MPASWKRLQSVAGLLLVIAICGIALSLLRRPAPDEGQAILLAKAFLQDQGEFDYPKGYWARAGWDPTRGIWRVGFMPGARHGKGSTLLVEVFPDRTCRTTPLDLAFFDF